MGRSRHQARWRSANHHVAGQGYYYAVDPDGRVRFTYQREVLVSDLVRAIDGGHYYTPEHVVIVTRSGEWGGNGGDLPSIITWLLDVSPGVLLGYGIDRLSLRRDATKKKDLEVLAADWATRRIVWPRDLREFVATRDVWFPSVLGQRLAISREVAERLLETLGYEHGVGELMEYTASRKCKATREAWERGEEASLAGFVSIDELLDNGAPQAHPVHQPLPSGFFSRLRSALRRDR